MHIETMKKKYPEGNSHCNCTISLLTKLRHWQHLRSDSFLLSHFHFSSTAVIQWTSLTFNFIWRKQQHEQQVFNDYNVSMKLFHKWSALYWLIVNDSVGSAELWIMEMNISPHCTSSSDLINCTRWETA